MTKISAVIITKNEETTIEDCIKSVSFCDQIIVVDNSSKDKTVEKAKKIGAEVFVQGKNSDFSSLRNLGLEKAKGEWVLYIDADERVSDPLAEEIKQVVQDKSNIGAFKLKRKNFYLGNHEWPTIERMERLFKKEALKEWKGELHESPVIKGEVGELENFLFHYTHKSLSQMLSKTIEWSEIEAKLRFDANHPYISWWRIPRVMLTAFIDSYIKQGGWKVGTAGLIESIYQSFSMFITYSKLWELQNKKVEE